MNNSENVDEWELVSVKDKYYREASYVWKVSWTLK